MLSVWTFLELLGGIPDPRRREGKKYKLPYILLFSILAIVSGANSYRGICTFIETNRGRLNEIFGLTWRRAPAHTAIRYILQGLDPDHIEQAFRKHAQGLEEARTAPKRSSEDSARAEVKVIALDGKTLRRSFDHFHDRKAAQILSAFSTETCLILAHIEIDDKSNEIPAAQKLLSELELDGQIITLDAMHCQKNISGRCRRKRPTDRSTERQSAHAARKGRGGRRLKTNRRSRNAGSGTQPGRNAHGLCL
jgi:hypothetical protein